MCERNFFYVTLFLTLVPPQMDISELEKLTSTHPAVILYFYDEKCGVCRVLWPQLEHLLKSRFPRIKLVQEQAPKTLSLPVSYKCLPYQVFCCF